MPDDEQQSLRETVLERGEQFEKDIIQRKNVVFCAQCGSTYVDQNFRTQLKCYNCGNVSIWDSERFSIARDYSKHDAAKGLVSAVTRQPADPDNRQERILAAYLPFGHKLSDMTQITQPDGDPKGILRKDSDELFAWWQRVRSEIDGVVNELKQGDGLIQD